MVSRRDWLEAGLQLALSVGTLLHCVVSFLHDPEVQQRHIWALLVLTAVATGCSLALSGNFCTTAAPSFVAVCTAAVLMPRALRLLVFFAPHLGLA